VYRGAPRSKRAPEHRRPDAQFFEIPRELVLDVHPERAVHPLVHFKKEEVHVLGMQ
jgi:hypothetical protein